MPSLQIETPVGPVTVTEENGLIATVEIGRGAGQDDTPLLRDAAAQFADYFAGARKDFDLPLAPAATPFATKMRDAMLAIPYGVTRTYGDIAKEIGAPPQAVGQGCGQNAVPIIVPCHRVVAAGGRLGGFSGGDGAPTKKWLLAHEAKDDLFAAYR